MSRFPVRFGPLPAVTFDGVERVLGLLPPYSTCLLPEWREGFALSAPAEVSPYLIDYPYTPKDQKRSSACGGYSASYAIEASHAIRTGGEDLVLLSPTYLYSKCNHGLDQGVVLSDLLEAAKRFGCCPLDFFPESALFLGQGSPDADRQAARFRLEEAYVLQTAQELLSAVCRGQVSVMGIQVGQGFVSGQVDAEGIAPDMAGPPAGGHALKVDEVYRSPARGLCVGGPNSWGPRYGRNGRYRVTVSSYLRGRIDAFALGALVPDPAADGPRAGG